MSKIKVSKVRPLQKRYFPNAPFVLERHDQDDGSISYEIWDNRPDTYRRLCTINDKYSSTSRGQAKKDAEDIVAALNHEVTIEAAERRGFEHAVHGGKEADGKMSMFKARLVLYFDDPKEREEFIKEWMAEHPSHHSIPIDRQKGN